MVKIKIFGPVFLVFNPEIDPGTPLDRPGAPRTSIRTKNQPRRPILRPFRKKIPKRTKKSKKNPFRAFKMFFFEFLRFFRILEAFKRFFFDFLWFLRIV